MRSKLDTKIGQRARQRKSKAPVGGKALQRLFFYLGERDPALNDDVLAAIAVPKAARPKFGLTKKALRAKPVSAAKAGRVRRGAPAAKSLAAAIAKAATTLTIHRRGARAISRRARAAAPAAPPDVADYWALTHSEGTNIRKQSPSMSLAECRASLSTRTIRSICCWVRPAAVFGKARTQGRLGRLAPIRCRLWRSERLRSIRQIRKESMPEAAKGISMPISAPAFTNPLTAARHGRYRHRRLLSASASMTSLSIRRLPRFSMPRRPMGFTNRPTAECRGV